MKRFYVGIFVSLVTVTVLGGVLELGARCFLDPVERGNITPIPPSIRKPTSMPGLPYVLRPRGRAVHRFGTDPRDYFDPGASLTYRTNSLGIRGPETSREKSSGKFRIVGIGDSFTFGTGVRYQDTFLSVLQKKLNKAARRKTYEVLNMGVMGYNTRHEVLLLKYLGIELNPDLVVLCFFLNDSGAGSTHSVFNVDASKETLPWWRRASRILDHIAFKIERHNAVPALVDAYKESYQENSPGWMEARLYLKKAKSLAIEHDFELVLMIFPLLWDLNDGYPFAEIHEKVSAYAKSEQIPVLDLLPAFAGFDGPELWVHPNNQHPNEQGHEIAGEALYAFLVKKMRLD